MLHTGDWKLDPDPLVGQPTDEAAFRALGDEGVLAMVCDSTNAMVDGHSGSEGEVQESLTRLIGGIRHGRVAVTCFASNVARVQSVARAARAAQSRSSLPWAWAATSTSSPSAAHRAAARTSTRTYCVSVTGS